MSAECQLSGKPAAPGRVMGKLVTRAALGTVPEGCGMNGPVSIAVPGAHGGV